MRACSSHALAEGFSGKLIDNRVYAAEIEDAISWSGSLIVKSAIQTVLELSLVFSILFDFKNYCDEINFKK